MGVRKDGFTLTEILIAIAIIVILVAILFPIFQSALKKSGQASCESNMKQIVLAVVQYSGDYDERFPIGIGTSSTLSYGWTGVIYPYVKSQQVYICPSDVTGVKASYAINTDLIPKNPGQHEVPQSKLNSPADTIGLFEVWGEYPSTASPALPSSSIYCSFDGNGVDSRRGGYDYGTLEDANAVNQKHLTYATGVFGNITTNNPAAPVGRFNGIGRHADGSNYAMLDGHAKWLKASSVSAGQTNYIATANPGNYLTGGSSKGQYPTLSAANTAYCGTNGANGIQATFSLK